MQLRLPASIAARTAASLLALGAVALAGAGATYMAMNGQAELIAKIDRAAGGPLLVERLRAEVFATVMESRGLYLAKDARQAARFADNLRGHLADVTANWRLLHDVLPSEQQAGAGFLDGAMADFVSMRAELARVGVEQGAEAADRLGNNDANRKVREAFSRGLDQLAHATTATVERLRTEAVVAGRHAALVLLAVTALAVVLTLALALWLTQRTIARPLRDLTCALNTIAEGKLDGIALPSAGRGEVGAIAEATTVVLARLRRNREVESAAALEHEARDRRQQQMDRETQGFGESVSSVMALLGTSAADMRRTAEEMANAIERASQAAGTTAAGAEASARNLAATAETTAALMASIREIAGQVEAAAGTARDAVARSEASATTIRGLTEAAGKIGNVVRAIAAIAGQTNLLALNATIEAAKAGEAGRGFAVVASEVKQLADQTATATSGIGAQVTAIQAATAIAAGAMGEVGHAILSIDEASSAIATAVAQQGHATRDITDSVQAVLVRNDEGARAMRQVANVAKGASGSASAALAAAGDVARVAATLQQQVDGFLAAMSLHESNRRLHARTPGNGAQVLLRAAGRAERPVELVDISRSGAALACDVPIAAGSEVALLLPGTQCAITAQVARAASGILALAFRQTPEALAELDRGIALIQAQANRLAAA